VFNDRLKELRIEKGLSQAELSKLLDVRQNTYSYWERGKCEPDIKTLIKISELFRVSLDYLTGRH
jgi:Predicted transcriptional regulators